MPSTIKLFIGRETAIPLSIGDSPAIVAASTPKSKRHHRHTIKSAIVSVPKIRDWCCKPNMIIIDKKRTTIKPEFPSGKLGKNNQTCTQASSQDQDKTFLKVK